MEIKRFKVFIGILSIVLCMTVFSGCSYAIGRFIKSDFIAETNNPPVKLNESQVFFPGGWNGNNHDYIIPAKIYDVNTDKLINLNVTMNIPRSSYSAIKYDNNNILIMGGFCADDELKYEYCNKIVEAYDIKKQKFERINDINYPLFEPAVLLLKSGKVFIFNINQIIIFDPNTKKFTAPVKKYNYKNNFSKTFSHYNSGNTYNCYDLDSHSILLDDDTVLIVGRSRSDHNPIAEIYNPKTFETIRVVNNYDIRYSTPVKLPNGDIIFYGIGERKEYSLSLLPEYYGKIVKFDYKTKTFTELNKLNLGVIGSYGTLLDNGHILLAGGVIGDSDLIKSKFLVHGILDLKQNKVINVLSTHDTSYRKYLIKLGKNVLVISKQLPSIIYKY